jgi:hypothetical protein
MDDAPDVALVRVLVTAGLTRWLLAVVAVLGPASTPASAMVPYDAMVMAVCLDA